MERPTSWLIRLFFAGAFLLLCAAVLERIVNFGGKTILFGAYTGGRLLEFAAILLVFAIALSLRQVLCELRKSLTS